jgi:hypothetical protein
MLKIYGASDDLVELERLTSFGQWSSVDEVGGYEEIVQVTIGRDDGGLIVEMHYGELGVWSAKVSQIGEDVPIPWNVSIETQDDVGYSVAVLVDCPDDTLFCIETRPE